MPKNPYPRSKTTFLVIISFLALAAFFLGSEFNLERELSKQGRLILEGKTEEATTQPVSYANNFSPKAIQSKYAIYMTTHLDQKHYRFLTECWPAAIEKLTLLQQADFIVYTSSNSSDNHEGLYQMALGGANNQVHIHRYQQDIAQDPKVKKQDGAVSAMVDPFLPHNNWFQGYEWIIRVNPDVLFRRDFWLLQTMQNSSVDAIMVDWRGVYKPDGVKIFPKAMHTDFYAFRPEAVNGTALLEMYQHQKRIGKLHAEEHIYPGFEHLIINGRMTWLPNVTGNEQSARTAGPDCEVVHHHPLIRACPNYFDVPI